MKKRAAFLLIFLVCLSVKGTAIAVEVAPRITDREIVENLAEIKATMKSFEQQFKEIDKRFEQVDKRFEQVDKRFEQVDKRFEQVDKRFEELQTNMRFLFGIVITMMIALFGYMVWDRRTMMKPLEMKIIKIEEELEMGSEDGSKISRLIKALRDLSKEDPKVEKVLKEFHLL